MTRPLDLLLHHMSSFAADGSDWERGFARSVLKQSRRRGWQPTPKQRRIMEDMVESLFQPDALVLEDDG